MRLLFGLLFLSIASVAGAHADPRGEVHPRVTARSDGNFTITFRYFDQREGWMRMMLGPDGKEVIPRHWINEPENSDVMPLTRPKESPWVSQISSGEKRSHAVVIEPDEPGGLPGRKIRVLPFQPLGYVDEASEVAGREVALVMNDSTTMSEEGVEVSLWCCRRDGFRAGHEVRLGKAAVIYDFPRVSRPLWTAGCWWVARIEPRRKGEEWTWTTVLSSVNPDTGKVEHHDLPGLSNWNTSLSMAVNAAGTICVAWHASLDGSYPGTARIVTAFFTPRK